MKIALRVIALFAGVLILAGTMRTFLDRYGGWERGYFAASALAGAGIWLFVARITRQGYKTRFLFFITMVVSSLTAFVAALFVGSTIQAFGAMGYGLATGFIVSCAVGMMVFGMDLNKTSSSS